MDASVVAIKRSDEGFGLGALTGVKHGTRPRAAAKSSVSLTVKGLPLVVIGTAVQHAQRRDQLRAVHNDVETVSSKQFLDELIEWLQAKHLGD
jgi:hypothetical protein